MRCRTMRGGPHCSQTSHRGTSRSSAPCVAWWPRLACRPRTCWRRYRAPSPAEPPRWRRGCRNCRWIGGGPGPRRRLRGPRRGGRAGVRPGDRGAHAHITSLRAGGRRSGARSALGLGERREQHLALRGGGTRADGDALHAHGASHGRRRPGGAGQPTGDASLLAGGGRAAGAGVAGAGWPRGARGARGGGGQAEVPLAQLIGVGALMHSCVRAAAWLLMGGGLRPKTSNGGTLSRYKWQF